MRCARVYAWLVMVRAHRSLATAGKDSLSAAHGPLCDWEGLAILHNIQRLTVALLTTAH
jgi:hypothetical protein